MTNEWTQSLKHGDHDAFEALVKHLSPSLYKTAYSILGNPHDAQDAVQDTFIKIYKALPRFQAHAKVSTWAYRILVNTCKDMLRGKGRYLELRDDDKDVILTIPDSAPMPEDILITKEKQAAVREAIALLPTKYAAILTLCDLEGLPYQEAARILACPAGTVKSRLHRARALLLKRLTEKRELFPEEYRHTVSQEEQSL